MQIGQLYILRFLKGHPLTHPAWTTSKDLCKYGYSQDVTTEKEFGRDRVMAVKEIIQTICYCVQQLFMDVKRTIR
jgi:hypothetical protein